MIARFQDKRTRRVWNKKIRYGCRKSLADRRLRVKGRFVKRAEQEMLAKQLAKKAEEMVSAVEKESEDDEMVDTPEYEPTEDQPYRRVRRHTIT